MAARLCRRGGKRVPEIVLVMSACSSGVRKLRELDIKHRILRRDLVHGNFRRAGEKQPSVALYHYASCVVKKMGGLAPAQKLTLTRVPAITLLPGRGFRPLLSGPF